MSVRSRIVRALLVAAAYFVILKTIETDGAAIRHNRRRAGNDTSNAPANSSFSVKPFNVDVPPQLLQPADKNQTSIKQLPLRNAIIAEDGKQKEPGFLANQLHNRTDDVQGEAAAKFQFHAAEMKTKREGDQTKNNNAVMDSDLNDQLGAGDGLGEADSIQNDALREKFFAGLNNSRSQRKKPAEKEILRHRPDENEGRMHQPELVGVFSKMSPQQAVQKSTLLPLKMDDLQPPDHIDGVRMEHDGHLNRDYKKEVLLGNHEEFEWESESKLVSRLKDIFEKADTNRDGYLDRDELKDWIMLNVKIHLNEAIMDNKRVFTHLDTNSDGFVTWKEFYVHFLLAKGHDLDTAEQHSEDSDTQSLDPDEKERIIRYKFRWAEADEEPQDNRLTFHELMNFRHPEQSQTMLVRMVKDLIDNFDRNEDKLITEEEFAMLPPGEVDGANIAGDQEWLIERKKEFRDVIDLNSDGFIDEAELKVYVDPHNSNHAKLEAENLIRLADMDGNGELSINEVLENAELFLGSKMVDASRNFHDEF